MSRKELDENRMDIRKRKEQELLEHCVYRIYNVRIKPDRKHFLVNIYSDTHFYESETIDYELCDEVWANELIPFQGKSIDIPLYNSEGLPLGMIIGHNVYSELSFHPSCQINKKTRQIKYDKNGYQVTCNKAWLFCLISKIDNWGNYVYVNGYDVSSQRAILEKDCYVPASTTTESDMLDVYIENIDLEEYRHRYKTKSVLSSVQKTETSILFVDFEIPFDKYSVALMYPFVEFPIKNTPIMPFRNQKKEYLRGVCEVSFQEILMKFIKPPYHIMDDVALINNNDYMYEPDIAIVNQKWPHIFIDIEIDEPYSVDKEPIHYIECENDVRRNKYFIEHGWIVVRFSEKQIVKNPLGCISVMEEIIASIDSSYVRNEVLLSEVINKEARWTLAESHNMINANARDKYLGRCLIQINKHKCLDISHKQKMTDSEKKVKEFIQEQNRDNQESSEVKPIVEVKKKNIFWGNLQHLFWAGKNMVKKVKSLWNWGMTIM